MAEVWEFLFKYPLVAFQKGSFGFASAAGAWVWGLASLALLAAAGWAYLRRGGRMRRRDRAVLFTLRGLLGLLLIFALAQPTLRVALATPQQNYLGILIDDSRSMRVNDGSGEARGAQVQRSLDASQSELLRALSERYRLRIFRFAGAAERVGGAGELAFAGGQTRLGPAMQQARAALAGVPLSGLVLISDGADRAEAELNASLLGLRAASVPVFTVGVGREEFDRDIEVRRVSVPRSVLRGAAVEVDVVLAQTGFRGRKVPLVVEDEGRIVSTEEIELPADGTPAAVRVHFATSEPGSRNFRFRVPLQEGERIQENNQREARIEIRNGPEKILYLEGEPRFEVKFMRRALEDDPQLQLVVLQRSAENKFLRLDVDSAAELASGFPRTREELFAYRGLILGSVEAGFFTREQLRLIADFVAERGGGLLALGGRRSFSEGGYAGTALASALPVELGGRDTSFFAPVKVAPTRAGLAHAALRVAPNEQESRARWASLPALSTFNRVTRLKPGATALLTGDGGQIALAFQRYGRGLSVAMPVQDSWTWQMHAEIPLEDQTHETFWRQTLRWLVSEVPDPLMVSTSTDRAGIGQPVQVHALLHDPAYLPVNDAAVVAQVQGPDGATRELPLRWTAERDGEYRASFVPDSAGLYQIRVNAIRGGRELASASLGLDAVEDDGELFGAQMRAPLLKRIAQETGGRFYTMGNLDRLPRDIQYASQGITTMEQRDLWDMPILFLLMVGLVAGEWGYRRKRGLQ